MGFVVDNTNPTNKYRNRYIEQLLSKPQYEIVGFYFQYFQSKIEGCLSRNSGRSDAERVPDIGIRRTHSKIEMPSMDEGFTKFNYVSIAPAGCFLVESWSDEI